MIEVVHYKIKGKKDGGGKEGEGKDGGRERVGERGTGRKEGRGGRAIFREMLENANPRHQHTE